MRRITFVITLLGLLILLFLLNSNPKSTSSEEELDNFQQNQKFIIQGLVIKETYKKTAKILHLNDNLSLQCDLSCPSYLNQNISAQVILEKYENKNYLKILRIKILN